MPYGSSIIDVKRAYRKRALKAHPDVNRAPDAKDRWNELSKAYSQLCDPDWRQRWEARQRDQDAWRRAPPPRPPPSPAPAPARSRPDWAAAASASAPSTPSADSRLDDLARGAWRAADASASAGQSFLDRLTGRTAPADGGRTLFGRELRAAGERVEATLQSTAIVSSFMRIGRSSYDSVIICHGCCSKATAPHHFVARLRQRRCGARRLHFARRRIAGCAGQRSARPPATSWGS